MFFFFFSFFWCFFVLFFVFFCFFYFDLLFFWLLFCLTFFHICFTKKMIFKFIGFWLSGEHKVSQFISVHKPAHITRRQDLVGPFGFTFYTAEMMLVWLMSTDITYDQIDIHHPMTGWLVYLPL